MADLKLTEKRFTLLHVGIIATICVVATAAFIVIIQYVKSQPVTSSPIKVRGGAMTARTSIGKNGGWVSNGSGYCTNVDITQFSTDAAPVSSAPAPANPTSLLADWTMVVFGRNPNDGSQSGNGFKFQAQPQKCDGSKGTSVLLTPYGSNGAFYATELGTDDDGVTQKRRFRDTTPDNQSGAPGCAGPNVPSTPGLLNGDEDRCERMSTIQFDEPAASKHYQYTCTNGECAVCIGTSSCQ